MQEMEKNQKEMKEESGARVYELGFLLVPSISEEEMPAIFGNLKELISSLGGVFVSEDMPKMMTLAYPMVKVISNVRNKFSTGYFGWIKFTMGTEEVTELKQKLDLDQNIIRFLILKTVKENTMSTKRFVRSEVKKVTRKVEEASTLNKEEFEKEVDKEIDALVEA